MKQKHYYSLHANSCQFPLSNGKMFWTRRMSHLTRRGTNGSVQRLLAPWISRNLDFVVTNKIRRGLSWVRLYCDLWSKERLKLLLVQMGRRIMANLTKRRTLYSLSGTALYATTPAVKPQSVPTGETQQRSNWFAVWSDLLHILKNMQATLHISCGRSVR